MTNSSEGDDDITNSTKRLDPLPEVPEEKGRKTVCFINPDFTPIDFITYSQKE